MFDWYDIGTTIILVVVLIISLIYRRDEMGVNKYIAFKEVLEDEVVITSSTGEEKVIPVRFETNTKYNITYEDDEQYYVDKIIKKFKVLKNGKYVDEFKDFDYGFLKSDEGKLYTVHEWRRYE